MNEDSLGTIAAVVGAGFVGSGDPDALPACGIATDSRTLRPGEVFVALRGERFDGHDFVAAALAAGAAGAVVDADFPIPEDLAGPLLVVPDTRRALGAWAAHCRRGLDPLMIAVAGSNGKTTTKDLVAHLLASVWRVLASPASFNNDVGVPLTLLELRPEHRAAVVEVGTNHPGEMAPLLAMIAPRIGILTSLGREHLEHFGDLSGVLTEQSALAASLPAGGVLIVNGDAPRVSEVTERTAARVLRVGFSRGCEWFLSGFESGAGGIAFDLRSPCGGWDGRWRVRAWGRHQALNVGLALAVASEAGIGPGRARSALDTWGPSPGRMRVLSMGDWTLIDDSYNANPDSMAAALDTLGAWTGAVRRVAVLGDMAELGPGAEAFHREAGQHAAGAGVACLVAIGARAGAIARGAREAGIEPGNVLEFADGASAREAVRNLLAPGDVVLVKASRSTGLDRLVRAIENTGAGEGAS